MSKSNSKVSFGLKASYGCGDLGLNLFSMAVGSFITSYYTDSVLMGAAFVGTMMLVARCFDGISDIIMGIIIDHTNTKLGKARPWVLISAIPCAISLVLLFSVPSSLSTTGKMIYIYVTYIFSQVVCGTAGNLSVSTLCTFMSPDLQVRAELAGARTLGSNIGSLIATSCTMMVVNAYGGGQKGYTLMAVTFGIAIIVLLGITGFNCKEYKVEEAAAAKEAADAQKEKEAATPMGQAVRILLTSKYTWIVTGCFVFNWLGICTNSTAMVYYARDVLLNSGYITYLAFAISLPAIIITAIGIVPKLTGKYGKKKMMMFGAGLQVIGFAIAFLVPKSLAVVLVGLVVRTFGLGIFVANLFASVADVADYVDITNKVHIAGVTNSVTSFGMKVGVGLGSATVGWVLAAVGYSAELANAGQMQSAVTLFGERLCYTGIPALFCLIVFILSCFVDVDEKLAGLRAANS